MAKKKSDNTVESPFKMVLPEKMQVRKDKLELGLYFYKEAIVLQTFDDNGGFFRMVSPQDLTEALTRDVNFHSGLLPENVLWWGMKQNGRTVALWVEPGIRKLAIQKTINSQPDRYTIPLPGLIFICQAGRPPYVFAATKRPDGLKSQIFKAPFPNVYDGGNTCGGSNRYPDNIAEIPDSFFRSFFTREMMGGKSKKYPHDLTKLWKELDGKDKYPLTDLCYATTVQVIMEMNQ
jgi:PRTRC genetic system protein B